jgi:hypothetical protein
VLYQVLRQGQDQIHRRIEGEVAQSGGRGGKGRHEICRRVKEKIYEERSRFVLHTSTHIILTGQTNSAVNTLMIIDKTSTGQV